MIRIGTEKHGYYSTEKEGLSGEDLIHSLGHLRYGKEDSRPSLIFPADRQFLDHGGRSLKYYQLIYITDGGGWFRNSNVSRDVVPGSFFIIRPGVWHSYAPDRESGWESRYVEFSGPVLSALVERSIPGIHDDFLNIGINRDIIGIYRKMEECASSEGDAGQTTLCAYVCLLVAMIAGLSPADSGEGLSDRNRIISSISYMEDHLEDRLEISSIAEDFNFSQSGFRRTFKSVTGISPIDFLKNLRIQKAKNLLLTTNLMIKQIAIECGFGSGEHFCNSFLKAEGKTPSKFREDGAVARRS